MRKNVLFSKISLGLLTLMGLIMLASCDPHQFPDKGLTLHLRFDTAWTHSEYSTGISPATMPTRSAGEATRMRYIIRFYDYAGDAAGQVSAPYREFVFYRNVTDNYDADFEITVDPGHYRVMAWADFPASPHNGGLYHDASDFAEVRLLTPHTGNTDRRDAFRGFTEVKASEVTYDMGSIVINMERPMAKYEFVSLTTAGTSTSRANVDLSKYKVVFLYSGYMPNAYSLFTDRPVDSTTGISYEGRIKQLSESEVSLGFDYVLVNHEHTSITVRVGLYNGQGALLSLSKPINVPIWRSNHTIVRGRFLMENASGNIGIDPTYDGEYNLIINR